MSVKLLTEHHLEFLSLKGGCRGWSESTLVKMSNCWKSHALARLYLSQEGKWHISCMRSYPVNTFYNIPVTFFSKPMLMLYLVQKGKALSRLTGPSELSLLIYTISTQIHIKHLAYS